MAPAFLALHERTSPVAFGAAGMRSAAQLAAAAARVAAVLPKPEPGTHLLLVFRADRFAFAASLWAGLIRGHRVALPHATDRETVLALAQREDTLLVLHDTPSGAPLRVDALLAETDAETPGTQLALPQDGAAVRLFSRNDRGDYEAHDTTWGALIGEALELSRALQLTDKARIVSHVSPGHWFGLALTVLAPLVSGGAMLRESVEDPAALRELLLGQTEGIWATVPHLLTQPQGLAPLSGTLARAVSGIATMGVDARLRVEQQLRAPVAELLGSAATGGVLFRRDASASLRTIGEFAANVSTNGQLRLAAGTRLAIGARRPFITRHIVEQTSDGFQCLGDVTDFATLAGERVCLPALASKVRALPGVRDAAVCVPDRGPCAEKLLAAVVRDDPPVDPSPSVVEALAKGARPVRVMYVDRIPRDPLGAPDRSALLRRFGLRPDGHPVTLSVQWGEHERRAEDGLQRARYELQLPAGYAYFDGHFPGYPILPGAAQLGELVMPCVRRARPELGDLRQLTRLKFLGRIVPEAHVEVRLSWKPQEASVDFSLHSGGTTAAAGRLSFRDEASS